MAIPPPLTEVPDRRRARLVAAVEASAVEASAVGSGDTGPPAGPSAGAPRLVHPGAWWAWTGGLVAAAVHTTNPVLLALIVSVAAFVVARAEPSSHALRPFAAMAKLGLYAVVLRLLFQAVFGAPTPGGTVLITLPAADLPAWAAGTRIGGPVTLESMVGAAYQGAQLATVLACFGAVNALASPYRLLRALPTAFYEVAVAVSVALSFTPQALAEADRLRAMRRLRGRPARGPRAIKGVAVPVLEGALQRSIDLAASMDSRGYGRRAADIAARQRRAGLAAGAGLLAGSVGLYGVLDPTAPSLLRAPALAAGGVLAVAGLVAGRRQQVRTRYRADRWQGPEWLLVAGAVAAERGVSLAGRAPGALHPTTFPLTVPLLPAAAAAGLALALAAGAVTTRPSR